MRLSRTSALAVRQVRSSVGRAAKTELPAQPEPRPAAEGSGDVSEVDAEESVADGDAFKAVSAAIALRAHPVREAVPAKVEGPTAKAAAPVTAEMVAEEIIPRLP
jgi:hypothetical protein